MGQRVIADNWSLQAVSDLMAQGIDPDDNPGIAPLTDPGQTPKAIPQAAIDFEALFDLLTDVVLRDQILVDDRFHDAWFGRGDALSELALRSIVRPHGFLQNPERLEEPRAAFLRRLLLNDAMVKEQATNESAWKENETTPHVFTSQLVWGGAGMLARAWVYASPYTPHPLRRRLFQRAGLALPLPPIALGEFQAQVAKHRDALYPASGSDNGVVGVRVILPALPALVLREATSLGDLFVVATQMRDQLSELRAWLSQFQEAVSAGEFEAIAAERKRLDGLGREVQRALGRVPDDAPTLNIGWGWFKLNTKIDVGRWVPKFDRVQTQVNNLTFAPSGCRELTKLLGFFGHQHSVVGLRTVEHFATGAAR
ncbi:hypothetical protein CPBF426_10590 [Xanthomonas arboricola pv. juglandis]|uniref:hypothetical protein n=1 Tax=Xanthomonas TaxID=338 RepID=UPI000E5BDE3D|nr:MULTISPECIES: hypothetical protein [Xanthomonas]CAD1796087.1 hypothetical protein XSP_003529 [Xanthomonas sp. CPBF 426]CAG2095667.1 hypothetical protein XCY_003487 [Xanthomonas euroxanthea]SYZ51445.1 hypothetical protein CPBF426_10590 [Xanthomonas arboricola pv. juglandis]